MSALTLVVAMFGTTISPYLFFWQSSQEVEDEEADPDAGPLTEHPEQADRELNRIGWETWVGMAISNLIAFFIMLTTAVTLNANGQTDIQTAEQAAEALRPIAGDAAFFLFSLGLIGTGLLAVPVLAGSVAYAVGEARGWHIGLERPLNEARPFYVVIALAILLGVGLGFTPLDPIKALLWSAVRERRHRRADHGGDDDHGEPAQADGPVRGVALAGRAGLGGDGGDDGGRGRDVRDDVSLSPSPPAARRG